MQSPGVWVAEADGEILGFALCTPTFLDGLYIRPDRKGQGIGSLLSQFGAYLGGHFSTTVPLNAAVFVLSIACASTMVFLVPRRTAAREIIDLKGEMRDVNAHIDWTALIELADLNLCFTARSLEED